MASKRRGKRVQRDILAGLDLTKLDAVATDLLSVVKPYLPALARAGQETFEGFIKHFLEKDWPAVDTLMYERMTIPEREALEKEVLSGAREAVQARYDRIQLTKQLAFGIMLRVITMVLI